MLPDDPPPSELDMAKVKEAVDAAFDLPEGKTAALVVTWKGRLIAERYAPGITTQTPLESWSMGKSVTATLMGVLIQQGAYQLWQRAPIPEWQEGNDLRSEIRIADLLQMSSGLRIKALEDPDYDPTGTYPDHFVPVHRRGGLVPLCGHPAAAMASGKGRTVSRNTDPVLTNYLIRLAVEKRGEEYLFIPAARAV